MPAKDRLQPLDKDNGTIATDITTRSALQSARAKASMATTLTLSDVINSKKLGDSISLSSANEPNWASLEETPIRDGITNPETQDEPFRSPRTGRYPADERLPVQFLLLNWRDREGNLNFAGSGIIGLGLGTPENRRQWTGRPRAIVEFIVIERRNHWSPDDDWETGPDTESARTDSN